MPFSASFYEAGRCVLQRCASHLDEPTHGITKDSNNILQRERKIGADE